jgi:hypothetical protein
MEEILNGYPPKSLQQLISFKVICSIVRERSGSKPTKFLFPSFLFKIRRSHKYFIIPYRVTTGLSHTRLLKADGRDFHLLDGT